MSTPAHSVVTTQLAQLGHSNVFDVLEQACQRYGDKPAFSCGPETLSFSELRDKADLFARYLRHEAGLEPGDRLAIQLPNLLQYTIAIFGAMKAGLVIVNTNPQYTPPEARHQFADSGAKAVVVLDKLVPLVRKIEGATDIDLLIITGADDLRNPVYDTDEKEAVRFMQALRRGEALPDVQPERGLDDLALLQYTGGTTGVSKGAMLTHRNILSNVLQAVSIIREGDVEYGNEVRVSPLPLYHIFAFTANCIASVYTGFHSILISNPRDLDSMIADIKRQPITLLTGINSLFVSLMNHPEFDSIDFSKLKWVNSGGAPLNTEIAKRWQARTGAVIREGYGLTETSPVVVASTAFTPYKEGFIGRAVIDTEMKTIDDNGNETPRGEPGELLIRGPQVMQGYWQRPGETAEVITDDGWLKTGDVGIIDDEGFLKLVDRKKDMILVSGFNVYPNDVEDAVMRHPGIRECVAVGVPDERKGEAIKLFVSLNDQSLDEQAIIAHCREHLTGYKVPSYIEIREDLPKSTVGKLLRRVLRDEARAQFEQ
ncbi:long-chain acyl-CoA synthetase [Halopseudomonas xinjiangensis]|uniref:Long-chain-fatty-acid--CoA ligase n=1 Tax=Halopseudomonas xinjiangensis TaxID=487184 RepID=A0A1H1XBN0_9GAMM|nr:AMP-binding protein [Halopseudomonas xinjiangensis]SDT06714.1 long-chain acyl-CoA synthetase [Halopseudomonas xinjiangensis]